LKISDKKENGVMAKRLHPFVVHYVGMDFSTQKLNEIPVQAYCYLF
jgi:hypothetical protein